jgi:hypothetical protein
MAPISTPAHGSISAHLPCQTWTELISPTQQQRLLVLGARVDMAVVHVTLGSATHGAVMATSPARMPAHDVRAGRFCQVSLSAFALAER